MIRRPEQIRLMACGLPVTPANRGGSSNASSSSTNYSYQDRRNAVQGGVGISGDGNTTNTTIVTSDQGAIQAGLAAALAGINGAVTGAGTGAVVAGQVAEQSNNVVGAIAAGAINGNGTVATNANSTMADVSKSVVSASSHLADVGLSMLQTNTALASSLLGGVEQNAQAVTGIASQLASTQIAAQNDNRYLIAAGMAVVAIVGFAAFKGKA